MPHRLYLARSSTLCSFTFRCGEPRYSACILFCETSYLNADREISTQNIRSHIAMSGNPAKAWKASLTCIPPLICMSTLVPQSR
jgi:hypothetical protein